MLGAPDVDWVALVSVAGVALLLGFGLRSFLRALAQGDTPGVSYAGGGLGEPGGITASASLVWLLSVVVGVAVLAALTLRVDAAILTGDPSTSSCEEPETGPTAASAPPAPTPPAARTAAPPAPLHFRVDDDRVSDSRIGEFETFIRDHPDRSFELVGHADYCGDELRNEQLSLDRAHSVRAWLDDRGIDASRIQPLYFGEDRPSLRENGKWGCAADRRVELRFARSASPAEGAPSSGDPAASGESEEPGGAGDGQAEPATPDPLEAGAAAGSAAGDATEGGSEDAACAGAGAPSPWRRAPLLLAIAAIIVLLFDVASSLARSLEQGGRVETVSDWGGFGSERQATHLSADLGRLIAATALAVALLALVLPPALPQEDAPETHSESAD